MKKKFLIFLTAVFAMSMSVSAAESKACKKKKVKLMKLVKTCKAMKKGSNKYKKCKATYTSGKASYAQGCGAGQGEAQILKSIKQWKKLSKKCKGKQSDRCATALWQLGHWTYKYEELKFIGLMAKFDKTDEWCADRDNKPKKCKNLNPPKKNHSKSLAHFKDYISKYPKHNKTPNVLFQASFILEVSMKDKEAYLLRKRLVDDFPNHGLVPKAWLRIGEYFFLERKFTEAIKAYKHVEGWDNLTGKEAALALYHMAESYYNKADYEVAAKEYFRYIDGSDKGKYPPDLRPEAMSFMAACFADMDNGIEAAVDFLESKNIAYKDSVYYTIGMKNKDHDRLPEAVQAFKKLLKISPTYVDAPLADIAMMEILMEDKEFDKAQESRKRIVKVYNKQSAWYQKNKMNTKSVEHASKAIRDAYMDIPQYHHAKGSKLKKEGDTEGAKKQFALALAAYEEFLSKYDKPSWDQYKIHSQIALVYGEVGDHEKSAREFNWVMDVDTVPYGRRPKYYGELLKKADAAYNAVVAMDGLRMQVRKSRTGDDAVKAYKLPETKKYFEQVARYLKKYSKSKDAPDLAYNVAVVHYEAKNFDKSVTVLRQLRKDFPSHKHIKLISRMLAQSQLEADMLPDALKEFEWLAKQYPKNDSTHFEIQRSIAAVLFQIADKYVKAGKFEKGAVAFLKMVNRFPKEEFSDKAVFEAAVAYEKAKKYEKASQTFMLMPRKYSASKLTIKSILRAATNLKKAKKPRQAATTFLFITQNFPKDSMAYNAIAYAATTYDSIPDKKMAAQTYEMAFKKYPKKKKTPGLLYNACLTYDEAKLTEEAIRCNKLIVSEYKNSSYALDAAWSIPIAYKNAKNWKIMTKAFLDFAKNFQADKNKLITAYYEASKGYMKLNDVKSAEIQYKNTLSAYDKYGEKITYPTVVPAEASFKLGGFLKKTMEPIVIKGKQKAKDKQIAKLSEILGNAASRFAKSATYASEKWTFKATNELGYLFVTMAEKIREQELTSKKADKAFVEKIGIVQTLPTFYEKAKPMFVKNITLAREQGFYNPDVIAAEEGLIEMYYRDCETFFWIADAFANSPRPPWDDICEAEGLGPEDCEDQKAAYEATIMEKVETAQDQGVPRCEAGVKAAAYYEIDPSNQWVSKLKESIKVVNPDHEALALSWKKLDISKLFKDSKWFANKSKIERIFASKVMADAEKMTTLETMLADGRKELAKLKKVAAELRARLAPAPGTGTGGTPSPAKP